MEFYLQQKLEFQHCRSIFRPLGIFVLDPDQSFLPNKVTTAPLPLSIISMGTESSARAVSAALSGTKYKDLLATTSTLEKRWGAELEASKTRARALHGQVLHERKSLLKALATAASIWKTLRDVQSSNHQVDELALSLRSTTHTLQMLDFYERIPVALNDAHSSLASVIADGAKNTRAGNAALLYDIHSVLSAVERLRDISLLENITDGKPSILPPVIGHVEEIRARLDTFLMRDVFGDILSVAKQNPRFLVSSIRIVMAEELRDEWWDQYLASKTLQIPQSATVPDKRLYYRKRFFKAISKQIDDVFQVMEKSFPKLRDDSITVENEKDANPDIQKALLWFDERIEDREHVKRFVAPCIPSSFETIEFYGNQLHQHLMRTMTSLLRFATHVDKHNDVLQILEWYSKYKEGSGKQDTGLDEFLADSDREHLVAFMRRHVDHTVGAQISNIVRDNEKLGEMNEETVSGDTPGSLPNSLFTSINGLVKHASTLGIPSVRKAAAIGIADSLHELQVQYETALAVGFEPVSNTRPRYVCQVANNMAYLLEYAEGLRDTLAVTLDESDRLKVVNTLEKNVEKFRKLAIVAINDLTRNIESSLSSLTSKLFEPNTGTEVMLDIISTLEDGLKQIEGNLLREHYEQLVVECVRCVVAHYLHPFLSISPNNGKLFGTRSDYTGMKESFRHNLRRSMDKAGGGGKDNSKFSSPKSSGLMFMSSAAVIAQIEKDEANLKHHIIADNGITEAYQKRLLTAAIEPLACIRNMYICDPTSAELVRTYRLAKSTIQNSVQNLGLKCGPPHMKSLSIRVAEAIWSIRTDVSSAVKEEAVVFANMGGDGSGNADIQAAPPISRNRSFQRDATKRSTSINSRFSEATEGISGLVWSPTISVSKSLR